MNTMPNTNRDHQPQLALDEALKICASEPLHLIGSVQPVGVLLAVAPSIWVVFVSSVQGTAFDLAVLVGGALGTVGAALVVLGAFELAALDSPLNPGAWRRRSS